ncbi:MAG: AEC family transporter [Terrimicrobiaceae bacterium]|nr:AEC family transporter [Terrimicrobiaceae bacterium]
MEVGRILHIVLPVFLIIGAGFVFRWAGVLTRQADASLLGILVKLFVPCLALDVIIGNEALTRAENLILPPILGFLSIGVGIGLAYGAARLFLRDRVVQRTFAGTVGIQNYGYIPLPLCLALFDREVVGVLFAFNLGVDVAMWSLGVATISGRGAGAGWWRPLINPPIVAVVVALVLNLAGAGVWIPEAVDTAWHMLGLCAVPLALLLTGALFSDDARPGVLRGGWGSTALALTVRLGILPMIILSAAVFLPLDGALRSVLLVQAAMPCAMFPIVLSRIHHGDMPTALRAVFGTSLVGLVTIPLWLSFGVGVVGKL